MFRSATLIAGLAVALSGCATQALREYKSSSAAYHLARSDYDECLNTAAQNPAYEGLGQNIPLQPGANPSLEQMASTEAPSAGDLNELLAWHRDVEQCRQQFVAQAEQSFPFMVTALEQNAADTDAVLLRLVHHEITWGTANSELSQDRLVAQERISRVVASWTNDLKEESREEMARRQRVARALSNLGNHAPPVVVGAYQPVRPPVNTSCMTIGGITNCTSQ